MHVCVHWTWCYWATRQVKLGPLEIVVFVAIPSDQTTVRSRSSCCFLVVASFDACVCVYSVHSLVVRWFWCLLRARTRSLCCATNEERWNKATTTLSSRSRTLNNIECCVSLRICVHSTHPIYMHHISTLLLLNNYLAVFFFLYAFRSLQSLCVHEQLSWSIGYVLVASLSIFSSLILFCFFLLCYIQLQ